jgi:M6 family metalloprotease-like protein
MSHRAWTFTLALFLAAAAFSHSVAPIEVTLSQPDGSTFKARAQGSINGHWMETFEGYSVVEKKGEWYYATKSEEGMLVPSHLKVEPKREGEKAYQDELSFFPKHLSPDVLIPEEDLYFTPLQHGKAGDKGGAITQSILTLVVSFTDIQQAFGDASVNSLMFSGGGSVNAYFDETSHGTLAVLPANETSGTVNDGVVGINVGYNHPNFGSGSTGRAQLVLDSFTAANAFIDYSQYDHNNDGSVTAEELCIILIVAGYENAYGGASSKSPRVWGHKSSIGAVSFDGVYLGPYCMVGERHNTTGSSTDRQLTIGIICHELGHLMLGLPDLYDRDGSSAGVGDWDLMASGNWNSAGYYSGEDPAHLSAWCKAKAGIILPEDILAPAAGESIAPAWNTGDAKRLWLDPYKYGEYFLVENRQQEGFDAGIPGEGLLIWHIDESVSTQNDNESHKLVDLESADGLTQLDSNTNSGDAMDPFGPVSGNTAFNDNTNPNARNYSGEATGVSVSNIGVAKTSMSADFLPTSTSGDHLRYDENGYAGTAYGYGNSTAWTAIEFTNTTGYDSLAGFQIQLRASSTVDFYWYQDIVGGVPSNLLYSETGLSGTTGLNRILLQSPQSFPIGADRVLVVRMNSTGMTHPVCIDVSGPVSGRCYIDSNGAGAYASMGTVGDFNQHLLLTGSAPDPTSTPTPTNTPQPTATSTNTPEPTATSTNTPLPTSTPTNTPPPEPTATPTPMTLVWVDFAATGDPMGTYSEPVSSLNEAVGMLAEYGTILLRGDSPVTETPETLRAAKPMRLEAWEGPVRIGASGN